MHEHVNDPYVKEANRLGFRSRGHECGFGAGQLAPHGNAAQDGAEDDAQTEPTERSHGREPNAPEPARR